MKSVIKVVFLLCIMLGQNFIAQQLITQNENVNGNGVQFTMDSRVADLLKKSEELCAQESRTVSENPGTTPTAEKKPGMSVSEVCAQMPKLSGFKILVASVINPTDANNIRFQVRENFPDLRTELDSSVRPTYKILAGSFFSRQSGQADLKRVKTIWKDASLVPYRIFCDESK